MDAIINALTTLLVTIDPPGLAPIFLSLTAGMQRSERRQVAIRGTLIAFAILATFAVFGSGILPPARHLDRRLPHCRRAAALLDRLRDDFREAQRPQGKDRRDGDDARPHREHRRVSALALPLIAGPGAISATILLSGSFPSTLERLLLLAVIAGCLALLYAALAIADRIDRFLGQTGRRAILTACWASSWQHSPCSSWWTGFARRSFCNRVGSKKSAHRRIACPFRPSCAGRVRFPMPASERNIVIQVAREAAGGAARCAARAAAGGLGGTVVVVAIIAAAATTAAEVGAAAGTAAARRHARRAWSASS